MSVEGRPTLYTPLIVERAEKYIASCEDTDETITVGEDGISKTKTPLKVKLPSIEGLALYLKISRSTVYAWQKEHEEFSYIIETLLQKQAQALLNNGLSGAYNSTISKVILTKHGYSDKQEIDQKIEHSGNLTFGGIEIVDGTTTPKV